MGIEPCLTKEKEMTVSELIKALKEMPQDLPVYLNVSMCSKEGYANWWNGITQVFVKEELGMPTERFVTILGGRNV